MTMFEKMDALNEKILKLAERVEELERAYERQGEDLERMCDVFTAEHATVEDYEKFYRQHSPEPGEFGGR